LELNEKNCAVLPADVFGKDVTFPLVDHVWILLALEYYGKTSVKEKLCENQ